MSIDQRVVEMVFNNKQFETGVQQSVKTLESLKKGLDLEGATKGLSGLSREANRFSLSGMSSGVDAVSGKLTAMGIVGITALVNIANQAVNSGKRMVSALTIDPVKSGFSEYETQINAIQTILANTDSKGTTLPQVNAALAELNKYADDTIYNFTEMTRNIGTFTAAGVDLDTSVSAIKGIANLAAVSGSTSQQASNGMYQLSQALSSGTVKLQDWNSVVNAGMGGSVFQESLKETARAQGIAIDKLIEQEGSFRETLSTGWLSSDILTQTLSKFTGDLTAEQLTAMGYAEDQVAGILKLGNTANDAATKVKTFTQLWDTLKEAAQSGWTQSWEIMIGDFEEAKELLTEISEAIGSMIGASADTRNAMLGDWKALGGRTVMIDAIRQAFEGVISVAKPIKEALHDIFPPMTGQQLFDITTRFKELTANFKIGEETANNIKRTFSGLFAILDIGKMAFFAVAEGMYKLLPAGAGILSVTGYLGDFVTGIRDTIKETGIFSTIVTGIGDTITWLATTIKKSLSGMGISFGTFENATDLIERFKAALSGIYEKVYPGFAKLGTAITFVKDIIGTALTAIKTSLAETFSGRDLGFNVANGGFFAIILYTVKKLVDAVTGLRSDGGGIFTAIKNALSGFGGVFDNISKVLEGLQGQLEALQTNIKSKTIMNIAVAIAVLAASLLVLSLIDPTRLAGALGAITVLFADLFGSMVVLEKLMGDSKLKGVTKTITMMIGMSAAILILSFALKKIGELDLAQVGKGLIGVGTLMGMLVITIKALSKNTGKMMQGALGLIFFATAINILAKAVVKLGDLNPEQLGKGLLGVGVILGELALFMKITDLDGMSIGKGVGIIALAVAINLLATAVGKFASIDPKAMTQGLIGMGVVLTEVGAFVTLTGDSKKVISTGIGLIILAASMLIFASAIQKMGELPVKVLAKGLGALAGTMIIMMGAVKMMKPSELISTGAGLLVMAIAMNAMVKALTVMGGMSAAQIAKSLITLGGSLLILGVAVNALRGAMSGAATMLVVAGALAILTPALQKMGNMSLGEIIKSLLLLTGVFTVLGAAALILAPVIPVILALGGALALIGAGVLLLGVGLTGIAVGLTTIAMAGSSVVIALTGILTAVISLIPMLMEQIGLGIVAFCGVIEKGAPAILGAITSILVSILKAITDVIPQAVELITTLITSIIDAAVILIPKLVDAGMQIISGILKGIADNIKDVVTAGADIVINFLDGVAEKLPDVIDSGINLIVSFINGLADAMEKHQDDLAGGISKLITVMLETALKVILGGIPLMLDVGKRLIQDGFLSGVSSKIDSVKTSINEIGTKAVTTIKTFIGDFKGIGRDLIGGFAKGISDGVGKVGDAARGVAEQALITAKNILGIHSPSKVFKDQVGAMIGKGMADGIKGSTPDVTKATDGLGSATFDSTKKWLEQNKEYVAGGLDTHVSNVEDSTKKTTAIKTKAAKKEIALDKTVADNKAKLLKEQYDLSVGYIDDEKYYNRMNLVDELAAWERVQAKYISGTDERKKADKEVYRLKKELIAEQKLVDDEYYTQSHDINEKLKSDVDSLKEAYEQALTSRSDALYNSYGLFDAISESEDPIQGSTLLANLQDQVDMFDLWQRNLKRLEFKGVSDELIAELEAMGPKTVEQIKALNQLSGADLDRYVLLWKEKHQAAKEQATKELAGLNTETLNKIKTLETDAAAELDKLNKTWVAKTAELSGAVTKEIDTMNTKIASAVTVSKADTEKQYTELTASVSRIIKDQDWQAIGRYIVEGINQGVGDNSRLLENGVAEVANKAVTAIRKELDINSPSRVFRQIGTYTVQGFVAGLSNSLGMVAVGAKQVGVAAVNSISDTLGSISDRINGDMELQPTIKPIIDLTNVENGLLSTFGTQRMINATGTRGRAMAIQSSTANDITTIPKVAPAGDTVTVENSFVIHAVIREEADIKKVSQELHTLQIKHNRGKGVIRR